MKQKTPQRLHVIPETACGGSNEKSCYEGPSFIALIIFHLLQSRNLLNLSRLEHSGILVVVRQLWTDVDFLLPGSPRRVRVGVTVHPKVSFRCSAAGRQSSGSASIRQTSRT